MSSTTPVLMEEADRKQLTVKGIREAMSYVDKYGHEELSYAGIQYLANKSAELGRPISTDPTAKPILIKPVEDKESTWLWQATVPGKMTYYDKPLPGGGYMERTAVGTAETLFLNTSGRQVEFEPRTTFSLAQRNVIKMLLPVLELKEMLKTVSGSAQLVGGQPQARKPVNEATVADRLGVLQANGYVDKGSTPPDSTVEELYKKFMLDKFGGAP